MQTSPGLLQQLLGPDARWMFREPVYWTVVELVGNLLFGSRFLLQWFYSERQKQIVVPPIFWHLSFWGSIVGLLYALHLDKVPVILGYIFLPIVMGATSACCASRKQRSNTLLKGARIAEHVRSTTESRRARNAGLEEICSMIVAPGTDVIDRHPVNQVAGALHNVAAVALAIDGQLEPPVCCVGTNPTRERCVSRRLLAGVWRHHYDLGYHPQRLL